MQKIPGKEIAQRILDRLKAEKTPDKTLAVIQVGSDAISSKFVEQKRKAAEEAGVEFRAYQLAESLSQDQLRKEVGRIASQKKIGGILVQLPLPPAVNKFYVLNAIPPQKDVDVLSERSLGSFYNGRGRILPPAAGTVAEIWKYLELGEKVNKAAVIGPGFLVGQPALTWLLGKAREIAVVDQGGSLDDAYSADLIISGAGSPGIIDGTRVKLGAAVLDFGYGLKDGTVSGDFVPPDGNENPEGRYTPTPGGTGPVLIAKLVDNFFILNSGKR